MHAIDADNNNNDDNDDDRHGHIDGKYYWPHLNWPQFRKPSMYLILLNLTNSQAENCIDIDIDEAKMIENWAFWGWELNCIDIEKYSFQIQVSKIRG